jgi:hypothetical protein
MDKRPTLPLAIAFAGLCIGGGLYFGLRAGEHRERESVQVRAGEEQIARSGALELEYGPGIDPAKLRARVGRQVAEVLEQQRPMFVDECWAPSAAKAPAPRKAPYRFSITIDATGREIARGITESRDAYRADVGRCLRSIRDAPIKIPAPGRTVKVDLALTLPSG